MQTRQLRQSRQSDWRSGLTAVSLVDGFTLRGDLVQGPALGLAGWGGQAE